MKRLEFPVTYLNDNFDDATFSEETTVQLDTYCCHCYRKEGEKPRLKPCPKYPVKAHVRVGTNKKEATSACIFKGKWMLYFIVKYFKEH